MDAIDGMHPHNQNAESDHKNHIPTLRNCGSGEYGVLLKYSSLRILHTDKYEMHLPVLSMINTEWRIAFFF